MAFNVNQGLANLMQGQTALGQGINQGLAGLAQGLSNRKAEQQMQVAQAEISDAMNSQDPSKIAQIMIKYPQFAQQAEQAFNFQEKGNKQRVIEGYMQAIKNPDSAEQILTSLAGNFTDPSNIVSDIEDFKEGKEQGLKSAELTLASLGVDTSGLRPKPMTEYQKVQTDLRRLENQEKALDRQVKREQNELKKQELQLKLDETKSQKEQSKQVDQTRINDAIQDAQMKQQTIDDLLKNDDYIDSLTGYTGRAPALTDAGLEAEAFLDNIKNSMTIENLGVMSGPLTDKDIQIIASASSRLRAGMSEKVLKEELNKIKTAYDRVINNFNKEANRKGYQIESEGSLAGKGPNARSEADILKQYGIE